MSFLEGYTPVNERLLQALERYPELSVVEAGYEVVTIGDRCFLECVVWVYRTPGDEHPIRGSVLEPFPGRTPFSKDSELAVGMTSAVGRALGYLGFGIAKGIASSDEVQARTTERAIERHPSSQERPIAAVKEFRADKPTEKMLKFLAVLEKKTGQTANPDAKESFEVCRSEIDRLQGSSDE